MNFADSTQRADYLATLRRLRMLASSYELQDAYAASVTLAALGEKIAELRNIEQTLVSIFQEREEAAGLVCADTERPVGP